MATPQRPLSPHLQIYRWGWTMSLSILHRMTGIVLTFGTLLLVFWLAALSGGPESYERVTAFTGHWFGKLLLAGWSVAFFYHLSNGIRHLLWDAGWGLELATARRTAAIVVIATAVMAVVSWMLAAGWAGGPA